MLNWNKHNHANFLTSALPQLTNQGFDIVRVGKPNEQGIQLTLDLKLSPKLKLAAIENFSRFMQERHKAEIQKCYPWRLIFKIGRALVLVNLEPPAFPQRARLAA